MHYKQTLRRKDNTLTTMLMQRGKERKSKKVSRLKDLELLLAGLLFCLKVKNLMLAKKMLQE